MSEEDYIKSLERDFKAKEKQIEQLRQVLCDIRSLANKAQRIINGETE